MNYELTDFQGNKIALPVEKARRAAEEAGLLEIEVNGQTHFVNPKNIASIKPISGVDRTQNSERLLDRPDFRGRPSPAKEVLRQRFGQPH